MLIALAGCGETKNRSAADVQRAFARQGVTLSPFVLMGVISGAKNVQAVLTLPDSDALIVIVFDSTDAAEAYADPRAAEVVDRSVLRARNVVVTYGRVGQKKRGELALAMKSLR